MITSEIHVQGIKLRIQTIYPSKVRVILGDYVGPGLAQLDLSPHRARLLGNALISAADASLGKTIRDGAVRSLAAASLLSGT